MLAQQRLDRSAVGLPCWAQRQDGDRDERRGPSVSRLERQADLYVSTLRRYIEAVGGRLEIHAVFPDLDAELRFGDFEAIDRDNPDMGNDSKLREVL